MGKQSQIVLDPVGHDTKPSVEISREELVTLSRGIIIILIYGASETVQVLDMSTK